MLKDWECMTDLLLEEPGPGEEGMDICPVCVANYSCVLFCNKLWGEYLSARIAGHS
jgi:hypothetical protein